MSIPSSPIRPGATLSGKISWFGGPGDPTSGPTTASGASVSVPGISLYNRATLGGYWRVTLPNGRTMVFKQTDLGPAPWTGRTFDFTYTAVQKAGYSTSNFPTDGTIHATYLGQHLPANASAMGSGGAPGGAPGGVTIPGMSIPGLNGGPTQSFDAKGYQQAQARYLLGQLTRQTGQLGNPAGTISTPNPLLATGTLTGKQPDPSSFIHTTFQSAQNELAKLAGQPLTIHPLSVPGFKGKYVNPISGFSLGRTDQGVDASAKPGTPIRALGDSRLVQVLPDWYAGQPLLLFKLLNGPKAGQYWYVAEQISPTTTQVGHVFHAGQAVGRFASSGTGIEIGWGSPTSNARTLAGATTGYSEGQVTPAGTSFKNFIGGL